MLLMRQRKRIERRNEPFCGPGAEVTVELTLVREQRREQENLVTEDFYIISYQSVDVLTREVFAPRLGKSETRR